MARDGKTNILDLDFFPLFSIAVLNRAIEDDSVGYGNFRGSIDFIFFSEYLDVESTVG